MTPEETRTPEDTGASEQLPNPGPDFLIRPMRSPEDASAFRALNEEWIMKLFVLEGSDEKILGDPAGEIVDRGGEVFMAHLNGRAVGCVALVYTGPERFSLAKMAVSPAAQGKGIGRALLRHAIGQAREMGALTLRLGSNTRLQSAIHLYESLGFVHLPPADWPDLRYARANTFMELKIDRTNIDI